MKGRINAGVCPVCGKYRQLLSQVFFPEFDRVKGVCNGCWAVKFKPMLKLKRFKYI